MSRYFVMRSCRILIIEDFRPWANRLQLLISQQPHLEVVHVAEDGQDGLAKASELNPDIILTDINLPKMSGLELSEGVRRMKPQPLVLFVTEERSPSFVDKAFACGAVGYILKTDANELPLAIAAVRRGEVFHSATLRKELSAGE